MLAIVSPAKTLDYKTQITHFAKTQPNLTAYSQQLIDICKKLSPQEVASLMKIRIMLNKPYLLLKAMFILDLMH